MDDYIEEEQICWMSYKMSIRFCLPEQKVALDLNFTKCSYQNCATLDLRCSSKRISRKILIVVQVAKKTHGLI